MTSADTQRVPERSQSPGNATGADDLRRMVLLLETADVLDRRAQRTTEPAQIDVLRRRAQQRRRDAQELRERLAARGAALSTQQAAMLGAPRRPPLAGSAPPPGSAKA